MSPARALITNTREKMSDEYPLYPELSKPGAEEAQRLIDRFKELMKNAAEEVLNELYTDVAAYIESDSWGNFRNQMIAGFRNYDNRKIQGEWDFKEIRQAILKHHREDIIHDLDQDNLSRIKELESQIETMHEMRA